METKRTRSRIRMIVPAGERDHQCVASSEGDWIVHRCLQCNFELRDNRRTGEWSAVNVRPEVNHCGGPMPLSVNKAFYTN